MSTPTVTRHQVRDRTGVLVAVHVRQDGPDGKRIWWETPEGRRGMDGPVAELPLYGIERLGADWCVVVEGEKAASSLMASDIPAVGTVTGASSCPGRTPLSELNGVKVYVWPDSDAVGIEHMCRVAAGLEGIARSLHWITPPGDRPKGWDAADALAEPNGLDLAESLIRSAGSPPEPAESVLTHSGSHAARTSDVGTAERIRARFVTAADLVANVPERPPFAAEPWLVSGAVTECVGKVKVGKTDLTLALVDALLAGKPFLGKRTERMPVIFLTEQPPASLRSSLSRAGLVDATELLVLSWSAVPGVRWPTIVDAAVLEAGRIGAGALFVDTLSRFAGIRGDGENSAGDADTAMSPLLEAAAEGLAVWVNRHERKSGGEVGDSGRGSSAFSGAVDIALALRRGEGNARPTVRVIHALSRFDETPDALVIERTETGYIALGDELAVARAEARAAVLRELPPAPERALAFDDLRAVVGPTIGRTTLQAALSDFMADGTVLRSGAGRKGDPYRYHAPVPEPPIHSAAPTEEHPAKGTQAQTEPERTDAGVDLVAEAQRVFGPDLLPTSEGDMEWTRDPLDAQRTGQAESEPTPEVTNGAATPT